MRERYYNLDLLKAVAAILIVFHHYQQFFSVSFEGINFYGGSFSWGYLVELFFMISGFVMAVNDKREKSVIRKFSGKCIRMYPSSILACTAALVIAYIGCFLYGEFIDTSVDYTNIITILSSYLLVFSGWFMDIGLGINNPTWYLCVLLLCYIIYYGIDVISKRFHLNQNILYAFVFFAACVGRCFGKALPWFFTYQDQRGYSCFFLGVLMYNWVVNFFSKKQIWLIVTGLAAMTGMGIWRLGIGSPIVLVLFLYPLLILVAVTVRQLSVKSVICLGGASFQMYLWHCPCFMFLQLVAKVAGLSIKHSYVTMILVTVLVEIIALLIYRYYEKPVTRWLKGKVQL